MELREREKRGNTWTQWSTEAGMEKADYGQSVAHHYGRWWRTAGFRCFSNFAYSSTRIEATVSDFYDQRTPMAIDHHSSASPCRLRFGRRPPLPHWCWLSRKHGRRRVFARIFKFFNLWEKGWNVSQIAYDSGSLSKQLCALSTRLSLERSLKLYNPILNDFWN